MGTRSLTIILDEDGKEITVLYRQYDGYLENHGKELAELLKPVNVGCGITDDRNTKTFANGMNCLAATLIGHFKTEVGNFYLYPAGTRNMGEEYTYTVYTDRPDVSDHRVLGKIKIKVEASYDEVARGDYTPQELLDFVEVVSGGYTPQELLDFVAAQAKEAED